MVRICFPSFMRHWKHSVSSAGQVILAAGFLVRVRKRQPQKKRVIRKKEKNTNKELNPSKSV